MDVLTGAGDIVTATPTGEHADLYFGFPNSYGTLGYATRLRVDWSRSSRSSRCGICGSPISQDLQDTIAAIVAARRTTACGSTTWTAWCSAGPRAT